MNSKIGNTLLIVLGFLLNLFLARNVDWNIVGIMGTFLAGIGLANLSYYFLPLRQNLTDWVLPVILLAVFGLVGYYLRSQGYFGLQGTTYDLVNGLVTIVTIAPLVRLYAQAVHLRENV